MVGTGGQEAGSGSVGPGDGKLLAELSDIALDDGQAGLDVIVGRRHGQIVDIASGRLVLAVR